MKNDMALLILSLVLLCGCSTLDLPNTGFEEATVYETKGQLKILGGAGTLQTIDFNEYGKTGKKDAISYRNIASLFLSSSYGITKRFEVSLHSYKYIPFPGIVGMKYRFLEPSVGAPFEMAAIVRLGYSTFRNPGDPIRVCRGVPCPSDHPFTQGHVYSHTFGLPLTYRRSDRLRFSLTPQVTYFRGDYEAKSTSIDTGNSLWGLRKSMNLTTHFQAYDSLGFVASAQFLDDEWNDISRTQNLSLHLGASFLL
jgi:hypothetical protein